MPQSYRNPEPTIFLRDKQKQGNKMDTSPFRSNFLLFHDQEWWVLNDDLVPNAEVTCRRRCSEDERQRWQRNKARLQPVMLPTLHRLRQITWRNRTTSNMGVNRTGWSCSFTAVLLMTTEARLHSPQCISLNIRNMQYAGVQTAPRKKNIVSPLQNWNTALQAGRSWVRFPMVLLVFFST